ncbi:MAG: adenylate/guanylate cyclase domain-containing protein [Treponema sp.]
MKKIVSFFAVLVFSVIPLFSYDIWNGVVRLDDSEILEREKIKLNGMWEFYPGQEFQSFNREQYDMAFIKVPGSWRIEAKKNFQSDIACYRIKIVGLKPSTKYAIFSRKSPATAANFFCNGEKVASFGTYSSDEKVFKPCERPVYAFLESDSIGSIELVVQVASFSNHESGITSSILFAEEEVITRHFRSIIILISFLLGASLFLSIIHFSIYFGDRTSKANFIFGFVFIAIICNLLSFNGSILSWEFQGIPYSVITMLECICPWMLPQLFAVLAMDDKFSTKKLLVLDKVIFGVFSSFGIIFCVFPIRYTNYIIAILIFVNFLFYIYRIYRMSLAFASKQIQFAVYCLFFVIIDTGYFFDAFFSSFTAEYVILFSQIGIIVLILFDVVYLAYVQQAIFHNARKAKIELENSTESSLKFFYSDFIRLINNEIKDVHLGDCTRRKMTVMYIQLVVISPNGEKVLPRDEFETCSKFIKIICDCVDKNKGIISNCFGRGCIAIFENSAEDAVKCAKEVMHGIRQLNNVLCKFGDPCVMFGAGIHSGEVIIGTVGEQTSLNAIMIGEGVDTVYKIVAVALKFGVPFLVSQSVIDGIDNDEYKMPVCQNSIETPENKELFLYELKENNNSEKEEIFQSKIPALLRSAEIDNILNLL